MEDKQVIGRARFLFGLSASVLLLVVAGCGGTKTNTEKVKTGDDDDTWHNTGNMPNFESEVGALDQDKVQETLNRTSGKLTACFNDGLRRVSFMGGEIKFALRINRDGAAQVAYLKESTLGDRTTEACMLKALQGATWPSPVGGREGLADGGFAFEPSPDERTPVALDPERLGKDLAKAKSAITTCRSSAGVGAGALKATMYIDTEGKPMAVGVSSADAKVEQAASCVVDALRGMTFPSPGSYAGKVSFSDD